MDSFKQHYINTLDKKSLVDMIFKQNDIIRNQSQQLIELLNLNESITNINSSQNNILEPINPNMQHIYFLLAILLLSWSFYRLYKKN